MQSNIMDNILDSILNIRELTDMEFVGKDVENRNYYYIGKQLFLRTVLDRCDQEDSYDIMQLPVTKETNGNIPRIMVTPSLNLVQFYMPNGYGYDKVVERAYKNEDGWKVENNFYNIYDALVKSSLNDSVNDRNGYGYDLWRIMTSIKDLSSVKNNSNYLKKVK